MRTCNQGILIVLSVIALTPLQTSADTFSDAIAKIRDRNDRQIYSTKVGYPLCSEVVQRKMDEDQAIARLLIEEGRHDFVAHAQQHGMAAFGERILDFAETFPSSLEFTASPRYLQLPDLSDHPDHPITHPRYYVRPQRYYCFAGNTPVYTISKIREDDGDSLRWGVEQTTMYEVDTGEFVLSSTHELFDDSRYQKDCWDAVEQVTVGVVAPQEQFQVLTYSCGEKPESVELRVTPKHRFLTRISNPAASDPHELPWLRAENLLPEMPLFGKGYYPDTSQQCTVTKNEAQTVIRNEGWSSLSSIKDFTEYDLQSAIGVARNGEDLQPFFVYNLTTQFTHQYYVGPTGAQVLVHNVK